MSITRNESVSELLRMAIIGYSSMIAELQDRRAQLAAMLNGKTNSSAVKVVAPKKRSKLSAAARAKISAAQKARWAKKRKEKAEKQKPNTAAQAAQTKVRPVKVAPAPAEAKKSPAEKAPPPKNDFAKEASALQGKEMRKAQVPKPDVTTPAAIVEQMALAGARFRITRGGSLIIGNLGSLPPTLQRMFLDHPAPHLLTAAARRHLAGADQSSEQSTTRH